MWDTIGIDLIGPLPETSRGSKYIMTVSCLFSKWPEATALPESLLLGLPSSYLNVSHAMAAAR